MRCDYFMGHHPHGWCGLKSLQKYIDKGLSSHHPHGWCGLKYKIGGNGEGTEPSPPTRVVWIEINSAKKAKKSLAGLSPPTRVVWIEI